MIYFNKGKDTKYEGGRTEKEIVSWMRKRATGVFVKPFKTLQEFEDFKSKNKVFITYFGDNADDLKIVDNVAKDYDDHTFTKIDDKEAMTKYNVAPRTVMVFKDFEEKSNVMKEPLTEKSLVNFAYGYSYPALMRIDMQSVPVVFHKKRGGLILFRKDQDDKTKELDDKMKEIAEKVRGKIPVCLTDVESSLEKELLDYVRVKKDDIPLLKIADTRKTLKLYTFKGEIDVESVVKFVNDWDEGKLKDDDTLEKEKKEEKKTGDL